MKSAPSLVPVTADQLTRIRGIASQTAIGNTDPITAGIIEFGLRHAERWGYHSIVQELSQDTAPRDRRVLG